MQGAGDIIEKDVDAAPAPPQAPKVKHMQKKWIPRRRPVVLDPEAPKPTPASARAPPASAGATPSGASTQTKSTNSQEPLSDTERIHLENIRKIQKMSPEEIEREREEIFKSMNPDVLQSLLRRAELKESENAQGKPQSTPQSTPKSASQGSTQGAPQGVSEAKPKSTPLSAPGKEVEAPRAPPAGSMAEWDPAPEQATTPNTTVEPAEQPSTPAADNTNNIHHTHSHSHSHNHSHTHNHDGDAHTHGTGEAHAHESSESTGSSVHFPPPPDELRKFFPDLPVETEKMAWMQPIADDEEVEYSSELASIAPSELRFDFKGNLITPRMSRLIPSTEGLHHHGDAPAAAGYTLPELAHLCRSSHSAQRSMAIQTAGRVLHKFRLGKFNRSSELQEGLKALILQTRIMESLIEAAEESTRSLTVRTLATEALWLANGTPSNQS